MIVECPSCHTRYRTESTHIVDEATRFECTKESCGHIFLYSPPLLEGGRQEATFPSFPPSRPTRTSSPPGVSDDIFTIPSDESFQEEDPIFTRPTEPITTEPILTKPLDPPEEELFHQSDMNAAFARAETPFYTDVEAAGDEQVTALAPPPWPEPETIVSPGMLILFLGALIFAHGVLSVYCFYHPETTAAALARLPVLGTLVAGEQFSAQHIILSALEGRYQTTKDGHHVFTVSGKATNNAAIPARTIQIEGAIYADKGKIVGQRLIFCGTNIAPDRLTNLTLREIGALQDLVPPKQFHVLAGDAVKFLIVFTTPPPTVREFSSRVVAAQFGNL